MGDVMLYKQVDDSKRADWRVSYPRTWPAIGVLVHTTSGKDSLAYLLGGSVADGRFASCDCLISRDGGRHTITPPGRVPYHAGASCFTPISYIGDNNCLYKDDEVSQVLIGIELECLESERPTYAQYDSLAEYIVRRGVDFRWRWPYTIYGHYAVARPPGRRADPVAFDWGALMGRLYVYARQAKIGGLQGE
jgi:N-acetyl-anhydromuramyl-L-alanine amidase AmpD